MKMIKLNDYKNSQLSDLEIIKRIVSGEKELYEILVRRNNQKLYRAIRSYLKDQEEIEDAMQETYLKAYEKLYQFKHDAMFSTWLLRIGINESLARIKSPKNRDMYNESIEDSKLQRQAQFHNYSVTPESNMIKQETREILEKSIDMLDAKYRTVYILKEIEGMSVAEVSDCLDLGESNVKVRLHRAKAMIKENLYKSSVHKDVFEFGFSRCDRITDRVMKQVFAQT